MQNKLQEYVAKKLQFITSKFPEKKELLNTLANYNSSKKINKKWRSNLQFSVQIAELQSM